MTSHLDRRRALGAAATMTLATPLLAACGDDEPDGGGGSGGGDAPSGGTGPDLASGTDLAATQDVPVGGGTILPDQEVVLTQPTEGQFKCFTAVCTHQGCIVSSVQLGGIRCECHGSSFSIEDGTPVNPPATEPLEELPVSVEGNRIVVA